MAVSVDLKPEEMAYIRKRFGREPNDVEWGMCDVMWSEHCSYKSSRPHLKNLPTKGKRILVGPGYDAGVVDIGGGWAAVFKIETHNHPSAIDPYNGAATGVGGIIRDIVSMGAQPVATLNSIHFGSLKSAHSKWLLRKVVRGIGDYGNCVGLACAGGEVQFDAGFETNCLVNACCLGFVKHENVFQSKASKEEDFLFLAGASTGRDGIHGVTFASKELSEGSEGDRPAVQVGDPFTKKLLIDAILEAFDAKIVKAIKDLGGGGFTCAGSELVSKGNMGAEFDADKVPQREPGMTPFEIMLSESQERFLFIVSPEHADQFLKIFKKYELNAVQVGVVKKGHVKIKFKGETLVDMDPKILTEVPTINRPMKPMAIKRAGGRVNESVDDALLTVLSSENCCQRRWVYEQYDQEVGDRAMVRPGGDAGVQLAPNGGAVAIKTDSNSLHSYLDPYNGGAGATCEAYRNVVATGCRPIALADNLSFGNPEKPEVMWQFSESIKGISDAIKELDTPCIGGNVSFYNEDKTTGVAIKPAPVILMLGSTLERNDIKRTAPQPGDSIVLVGQTKNELGGSEYEHAHGVDAGEVPQVDLKQERANGEFVLANLKHISAIHDVSKGGLVVALAEMCIAGNIGMEVDKHQFSPRPLLDEAIFFSESHGRYVLATKHADDLVKKARAKNIPAAVLGKVTAPGGALKISEHEWPLAVLKDHYETPLWQAMEGRNAPE